MDLFCIFSVFFASYSGNLANVLLPGFIFSIYSTFNSLTLVSIFHTKKASIFTDLFFLFYLATSYSHRGKPPTTIGAESLTSVFGFRLAISGESPRQLVRSDPHVPTTHIPVFSLCVSLLAQDVLTSTLPQDVALLVEVP